MKKKIFVIPFRIKSNNLWLYTKKTRLFFNFKYCLRFHELVGKVLGIYFQNNRYLVSLVLIVLLLTIITIGFRESIDEIFNTFDLVPKCYTVYTNKSECVKRSSFWGLVMSTLSRVSMISKANWKIWRNKMKVDGVIGNPHF